MPSNTIARVFTACLLLASTARAQDAGTALTRLLDARQTRIAPIDQPEVVTAIRELFNTQIATIPPPVSSASLAFRTSVLDQPPIPLPATTTFGSLLIERPLTPNAGQLSVVLTGQYIGWTAIDGRSLASEGIRFSVHTVSGGNLTWSSQLHVTSQALIATADYGLRDNLDVAASFPLLSTTVDGTTTLTTNSTSESVAIAGTSTGIGDISIRGKYRWWGTARRRASDPYEDRGAAVLIQATLPSGNADQLLGAGVFRLKPSLVVAAPAGRIVLHGTAGYAFGSSGISVAPPTGVSAKGPYVSCNCGTAAMLVPANYEQLAADISVSTPSEVDYGGGGDVAVARDRFTMFADLVGRMIVHSASLRDFSWTSPSTGSRVTQPFLKPGMRNVGTVSIGGKLLVHRVYLFAGTIDFPITDSGLRTGFRASVGVEYAFATGKS